MVTKIISGAQTGADRAGLDVALVLGLGVGGWIPRGRRTDEGPLSPEDFLRYKLCEHSSTAYLPRTKQNVLESHGTVLFGRMTTPGCALTIRLCRLHGKPLVKNPNYAELRAFVDRFAVRVLNVAGNRERTNPGIYALAYHILLAALGPDNSGGEGAS